MKIGPKMPGVVGPGNVSGPEAGKGARGAEKGDRAAKFSEVLGPGRAEATGAPVAGPGPEAVAGVAARYASGELTRAEAAREVAAQAVGTCPAGFDDDAARAGGGEMAEFLAEDPSFSALLDAAGRTT